MFECNVDGGVEKQKMMQGQMSQGELAEDTSPRRRAKAKRVKERL